MNYESIKILFESQRKFFHKNLTQSLLHRQDSLYRLKKAIYKYEKSIVSCLYKDLKKPEAESLVGEVYFLLNEIRWAQKNLKNWMRPQKVPTPFVLWGHKSYVVPCPLGVVLIISPWNYPFRLSLSPLIGALSAGNCAILKPSEKAPHSAELLKTIISEAFPHEHVEVVTGGCQEAQELLKNPFDHIFFTGSERVGKSILETSLPHLTPLTLELGGTNPCFVHKDAHLKSAVRRIAWSKFINNGQTCLAPNFVFVHKNILPSFLEGLTLTLKGWVEKQALPRIVDQKHWESLCGLLDGHNIYYGGKRDKDSLFMEPTLILNPPWKSPLVQQEIFGPLLSVLEYTDFKEALKLVQTQKTPLAAYLFTHDKSIEDQFIKELKCGGCAINDAVLQAHNLHLPFGGLKESGWGCYHGKHSFHTFSHKKALMKGVSHYDFSARFPPYTEKKLEFLKRFYKIYNKWL